MLTARSSKARRSKGSIAEFTPIFMILILVFIMPAFDLITLALSYGCCLLLNYQCAREASFVPNIAGPTGALTQPNVAVMGPRVQQIEGEWRSLGFGKFVKIQDPITTSVGLTVTAIDAQNNVYPWPNGTNGTAPAGNGTDCFVSVQQTFTVDPWLYVPYLPNVSGISKSCTFTITGQRMIENG
jgi:hypothetical protein